MRNLLLSLTVIAGATLAASSPGQAARAVALPVYTGPVAAAPALVLPVQYYEGRRHGDWRRREAYERWRRHHEWRRHHRGW